MEATKTIKPEKETVDVSELTTEERKDHLKKAISFITNQGLKEKEIKTIVDNLPVESIIRIRKYTDSESAANKLFYSHKHWEKEAEKERVGTIVHDKDYELVKNLLPSKVALGDNNANKKGTFEEDKPFAILLKCTRKKQIPNILRTYIVSNYELAIYIPENRS